MNHHGGARAALLVLSLWLVPLALFAQQDATEETPRASVPTTDDGSSSAQTAPDERNGIGWADALVLGVVEGVTEYLPISSTGHLILTNAVLGLDADSPLTDAHGQPVLHPPDETGVARPYTLKDAADAYAVVIQGGAILAVVLLYWRRLWGMLQGLLGRDSDGLRLAINLLIAFIPAALLGPFLDGWIEQRLFHPGPVAIALLVGAFLMFWVEKRRRPADGQPVPPDTGPDLPALNARQCLCIGLLQCVAMWPGTSRSMMTIVGGYLVGLNPARAAEFSFLLGLITLTAASGYRVLTDGPQMLRTLEAGPVLFGCLVATIAAALSVKWLVSYLSRHGLALFAWYRIGLALLIYAAMAAGLLGSAA